MKNVRGMVRNWRAEVKTAAMGVVLAFQRKDYVATMLAAFLIFGTVMSLLSSGTAGVGVMFSGGIGTFFNILGKAFLGLFGVGREVVDWLVIFGVSLLQAMVIGLVSLIWRGRKRRAKEKADTDDAERAGIAAGLAVLGSGCPTCGTTLLMPVVTAVAGSGGMALASAISGILTAAAIIVLLFSLKKLGQEAYTLLVTEKLTKKRKEKK